VSVNKDTKEMMAQDFFDLQVLFHQEYEERVYKTRLDPMFLADRDFKSHFRFRQEYCGDYL
jgi:hypothetical protein